MTQIPKDPVMLLNYINTQLRDCYPGVEELCGALMISREDLDETLGKIDYVYSREKNQYI